MEKITISKKQFESYVRVQKSGVTNMFDVKNVTALTGLDKNKIMEIMSNYNEIEKFYNTKDKIC